MSFLTPEKIAKGYSFTGIPCKHGHISVRLPDRHCRECVRIKSANRLKLPEVKLYMRNWRQTNVDKRRNYERKWRATNPDDNSARTANRRAREFNAEGNYSAKDIRELRKLQTNCNGCTAAFSKETPSTIDHIIALNSGGSNWPSNIQLLCKSCNSAKGDRNFEEWLSVR